MMCSEIENRLPAYLEDLLSPEERKSIAGHLASCPHCSRAFADLKKAEELVHGLGELEPPPFFEERIMSRVREEAGQKQGILRKFFFPLHIKIPIQTLATLSSLSLSSTSTRKASRNETAGAASHPLTELERARSRLNPPKPS